MTTIDRLIYIVMAILTGGAGIMLILTSMALFYQFLVNKILFW